MGQSIPLITFGAFALYLLYRSKLIKFTWRSDYIKSALAFGIPLIPHISGMFMLSVLDRVIIKQYLGLEQIGIYMVAVQLAMAMSIVANAINKAYVPWLYARLKINHHGTKRFIVAGTYIYFVVALLMALLVAVIAPWLVPWIAGENYAAAGAVLGWLALGQAFSGMYLMVAGYIFYSQRTIKLSITTIIAGTVHLGLVYLFVQTFGIKGAAMAFAISMGLRFVITWYVAQSQHAMPWATPAFKT